MPYIVHAHTLTWTHTCTYTHTHLTSHTVESSVYYRSVGCIRRPPTSGRSRGAVWSTPGTWTRTGTWGHGGSWRRSAAGENHSDYLPSSTLSATRVARWVSPTCTLCVSLQRLTRIISIRFKRGQVDIEI